MARWQVPPLHRSRRGIDQRVMLAGPPWLLSVLFSSTYALRPGSRLCRAMVSHSVRVGVAGNNRRDYKAIAFFLTPHVELHAYPDAPERRPVDLAPDCYGREAYVKGVEDLKAGFESFFWELRELIDPGGNRFGARTERIGTGRHSGIEVRDAEFHVWQTERGPVRRQWVLSR